jgi:hypothetical protein
MWDMEQTYRIADMLKERQPNLDFRVRISHRPGSSGPHIAIYENGTCIGHVNRGDFK